MGKRDELFQERSSIRSEEALNMAIQTADVSGILNLILPEKYGYEEEEDPALELPDVNEDELPAEIEVVEKKPKIRTPLVRVVDPLVRTNLPLQDFTPQSSYFNTHQIMTVKDSSGNDIMQYKNDLILKSASTIIHKFNTYIWNLMSKREDTLLSTEGDQSIKNVFNPIFLRMMLKQYKSDKDDHKQFRISKNQDNKTEPVIVQDADNFRKFLSNKIVEYEDSELPTYLIINGCSDILNEVDLAELENNLKQKIEYNSLKMKLDLLKHSLSEDHHEISNVSEFLKNTDKLVERINTEVYNISTYEELLKFPHEFTSLNKSEWLNLISENMHKNNVKFRIQTYNNMMEILKSFVEKTILLENMRKDGIEPSIYTYSQLYESIFDLMTFSNNDKDYPHVQHIYR